MMVSGGAKDTEASKMGMCCAHPTEALVAITRRARSGNLPDAGEINSTSLIIARLGGKGFENSLEMGTLSLGPGWGHCTYLNHFEKCLGTNGVDTLQGLPGTVNLPLRWSVKRE